MKTKRVEVRQIISVTYDETKFSPEFIEEFKGYMYPFMKVDDHIEHLAQLHARGLADASSFIEGYGEAKDFGLVFSAEDLEMEIMS